MVRTTRSTLEKKEAERGLEPDACSVFGDAPIEEWTRPDLAIEVVWISGGLSKLEIYRRLDVPEVWTWSRGRIHVHVLEGEAYVEVERSRAIPDIEVGRLAELATVRPMTQGSRMADLEKDPSLAASITRTLLATAERLGADPRALVVEVGIPRATIEDPDGRVPVRAHIELFRRAVEKTGRADFALEVGRAFRPGTLSVLSHAAMNAPDLRGAWSTLARYWRLVAEGTRLSLLESKGEAVMAFEVTDPSLPFAREGSESITAGQVLFARWLTQRDLRPLEVSFVFSEPRHAEAHRQLFGASVRFAAERTEVRWARSVLEVPVVAADPTLRALFEARLREAAASVAVEAEPEVLGKAREVILANLERGEVTLDLVARRLATSRRSLQRRLSEAGTTFQELLDDCRRGLCFRLLEAEEASTEEIAFLVGFAEPSSFFRAFRRWTDTTPAEWRSRPRP